MFGYICYICMDVYLYIKLVLITLVMQQIFLLHSYEKAVFSGYTKIQILSQNLPKSSKKYAKQLLSNTGSPKIACKLREHKEHSFLGQHHSSRLHKSMRI